MSSQVSKEKLLILSNTITQIANDLISNNLISNLSCPSLLNPQIAADNPYQYGPINSKIIEEPTSDQETTDDLEIFEVLNKPTFIEICDYFLDLDMIRTISTQNLFPREAIHAVILPNIPNTNIEYLRQWVKDINIPFDSIRELRIVSINKQDFSLIKFDSIECCQDAFNKISAFGTRVSYCYDGTDLSDSNWYSVVIRDVPTNFSIEEIKSTYFHDFEKQITKTIGPALVGGTNSCLFVTKSLEMAEKICYFTNITYDEIKAHLHYKTCRTRFNKEKSHFAEYFTVMNRGNLSMNKYLSSPKLVIPKKKQINILDVLNTKAKKNEMMMKDKRNISVVKLSKLVKDTKGKKGENK